MASGNIEYSARTFNDQFGGLVYLVKDRNSGIQSASSTLSGAVKGLVDRLIPKSAVIAAEPGVTGLTGCGGC